MHSKKEMNRRQFLAMTAALGAGAALAACQPKEVEKIVEKEVTREVEKEVAAEGAMEIGYLTDLWLWQKIGWSLATDQYNMNHRGELSMVVDPTPEGFETKVREMIERGEDLPWDGKMRVRNRQDAWQWYNMGIMAPVEDYIRSSTIDWAGSFFDELLDPVREMFTIEGELYYIPWDVEVFVRHYRAEEWEEALGEKPAETLDEFNRQLLELKEAYPDKVPLCLAQQVGQDYQMFMQLFTDEIWVQEGDMWLPNYESEAYEEYLNLYKFWYENEIITDESWGPTWTELWNRGNALTTQTGAAWGFAEARKVWGREAIKAEPVVSMEKGKQTGTFIFSNASSLFKNADHPQEVVDWQLWTIDPTIDDIANYSFYKHDLNYYHLPVFNSAYEDIVPQNPDWEWMGGRVMESVENAQIEPIQSFPIMIGDIRVPWERQYAMGKVSLEEAVTNVSEATREQLEKQMVE